MVNESALACSEALAELFKNFGDSTRVRIMLFLLDGPHSVTEITEALSMTQSAISHQLRILRQAKLVSARREGRTIYYALADSHVQIILQMGTEHVLEETT